MLFKINGYCAMYILLHILKLQCKKRCSFRKITTNPIGCKYGSKNDITFIYFHYLTVPPAEPLGTFLLFTKLSCSCFHLLLQSSTVTQSVTQNTINKLFLSYFHRFLGTGESFACLAFQYRLGKSTVSQSVHMTCRAIERWMMATQFLRATEQMWRDTVSTF